MKTLRRRLTIAAFIAAAAGAGCASGVYRIQAAEGLAPADLAVLEESSVREVTVSAIDGKSRPWGFIERYELTPGRHRVTVILIKGGISVTSDPCDVEFIADRGKAYVLVGSVVPTGPHGGRWSAWIVSKENGQTVSAPIQR